MTGELRWLNRTLAIWFEHKEVRLIAVPSGHPISRTPRKTRHFSEHHPGNATNVDRMLRSVRASLDYYSEQFDPYPHRHIYLVERPGHGAVPRALPGEPERAPNCGRERDRYRSPRE